MSYSFQPINNYGFNPQGFYQRGGNSFARQRSNQRRGFNNTPGQYKRRSQVKMKESDKKGGFLYLTGWKVGRRSGMRIFQVFPSKNPVTKVSKAGGNEMVSCACYVTNKDHGTKGVFPAWWLKKNNVVIVPQLGLRLNPNTGFISYMPKK